MRSRPSPPTSQSPKKRKKKKSDRDYFGTHNQNNHGIIGNGFNNIVNSGNNNPVIITKVTNAEGEDVELDRLLDSSISKDALHNTFDALPECHPGTRKTVLKEFGEWFDNSSSEKSLLLWLHGPAGVGKSVIAKTIVGSHHQVVASFFFSTSSDRSAATLFPTLAWQLAREIPETRQHIIASLRNNGSLLTSEIKEQFDHLIANPLKKCQMISLPVIVIDGLDECTNEYALSRLLQVLVRAAESGDMPLRFIICSRPEPRIRAILKKVNDHQEPERKPSDPQRRSRLYWLPRIQIQLLWPDIRNRLYIPIIWGFSHPTLLLQDVWKLYRPMSSSGDTDGPPPDIHNNLFDRISPDPLVSEIQIGFSEESKDDIAKYLADKFNAMGPRLGESDISQLVERSCGQFLCASTIVKLLDDSDPKDVLDMARRSSLPTPDLNILYKVILKRVKDAIRIRAQEGGPDYATELRILMDTLAILIVFAENVHFFNVRENFPAIESLIGIEKSRLTKKLCKMHSVLNVVPGVSISVHHRSFLEFLQSQKRSGEHYVAYPKALRRFLVLLGQAGLKYFVMDWRGQLLDNGRKMREDLENLALACRRDYFKRSSSPETLIALHDLIHYSLPFVYLVPFCQFIHQLKESFIGAPTSSSAFAFILEYVFLAFFCLLILSSGSFIISLTIYTLPFHLSLTLPLFHPFLHLHFVTMVGILLSSRQSSSLEGPTGSIIPMTQQSDDNIEILTPEGMASCYLAS
ncbi:hypothetical protein M378DRAFT_13287 [Amanita muscaria Koide BX008]|uniref:Nephrocystin 3-like N-terminal domain-containing protein n=1 Tax=Amanita muscaria (strain Koide BX008) TaxID=946122 RepID=A0A0C2SFH1_AMAMK|nr:hypothetical protein M378DRAFT_13287 [Amanita muscaria Koide BX008]